jgi:hypothetical protein
MIEKYSQCKKIQNRGSDEIKLNYMNLALEVEIEKLESELQRGLKFFQT